MTTSLMDEEHAHDTADQRAPLSVVRLPSPKLIAGVLVILILLMGLVGASLQWYRFTYAPHRTFAMLDLNAEANIPTWLSASLLLVVGLLAMLVAGASRHMRRVVWMGWALLAVGAMYISLDELAQLHERLGGVEPPPGQAGGIFYFRWVIPALVMLPVVLILILPFLLSLPSRTRWLLLAGGSIYLAGALGMEMIAGPWVEAHGQMNVEFALMSHIEEVLEMLAATTLLYAILDHVRRHLPGITIRISPPERR